MLFPLLHEKEQAESPVTQGVTDSTLETSDVVPPSGMRGMVETAVMSPLMNRCKRLIVQAVSKKIHHI